MHRHNTTHAHKSRIQHKARTEYSLTHAKKIESKIRFQTPARPSSSNFTSLPQRERYTERETHTAVSRETI